MGKIRKGDDVVVIAGRDKGKRGSVLVVLSDRQVVVEGVNVVKRHTKPNPNMGKPGGIVSKEAAVDVSNVMLFNPKAGKGDRIGFKVLDNGAKVRVFKSNGEVLDA